MRKSSWRASGAAVGLTGLAWVLGATASWADQAAAAGRVREAATAQAQPAGSSQSTTAGEVAAWTPKEARFVYQGFTSRYSCDGLRDRIREILLQLGARKQDLKVTEVPCSSATGQPDPFPGVHIRMSVLQPAGGDGSSAAVPAHWKTVDLSADGPGIDQSGQCELLEQVRRSILPLFTTRNVDYSSNCVPHQLQIGATRLRADVLVPDRVDTQSPQQR